MGISTKIERRSAANLGVRIPLLPPIGDGSIGTQDRWLATGTYTGISVGAPVAVITTTPFTLPATLVGLRVMESPFTFVGTINVGHKTSDGVPTASFDSSVGYQVGNIIIYNNSDIYMCVDNTVGAAVWRQLN